MKRLLTFGSVLRNRLGFTRCPLLFCLPWRAGPLYMHSHQFNYSSAVLCHHTDTRPRCLCHTGRLFTLLMMCRSRSQPLCVNGGTWRQDSVALLTQVYIVWVSVLSVWAETNLDFISQEREKKMSRKLHPFSTIQQGTDISASRLWKSDFPSYWESTCACIFYLAMQRDTVFRILIQGVNPGGISLLYSLPAKDEPRLNQTVSINISFGLFGMVEFWKERQSVCLLQEGPPFTLLHVKVTPRVKDYYSIFKEETLVRDWHVAPLMQLVRIKDSF